jgi:hypothetical protein
MKIQEIRDALEAFSPIPRPECFLVALALRALRSALRAANTHAEVVLRVRLAPLPRSHATHFQSSFMFIASIRFRGMARTRVATPTLAGSHSATKRKKDRIAVRLDS